MGADFALGTTGVAGTDRDERGNEVGTVYVALAGPDGTLCRLTRCGKERDRVRTVAAHHAFDMLLRYLKENG